MKPTLTKARWKALKKLEMICDRPFIGTEVNLKGPSLFSLEKCGWVQRVEEPEGDTPFAIATQGNHWRVTDAGREVIAALPELELRRM
jgi:hypothetical protein